MSIIYEKLVSASDSTIVSCCVCSLADGRVHAVANHGSSLSVREIRKNHVELIATASTGPILFMTVIRRGTRGVIFLLLEGGVMKMMGLSKSHDSWELFTNWSRTLPEMAGRSSAVCEYDELRCAVVVFVPLQTVKQTEVFNSKKRSVVLSEDAPLVYFLRFSFDKFPKVVTKVDSMKWKQDWTPLNVSFVRSETAPWSFGCFHPSVGIKTFAVKIEEAEFRELKLVIETVPVSPAPICGMHFVEGKQQEERKREREKERKREERRDKIPCYIFFKKKKKKRNYFACCFSFRACLIWWCEADLLTAISSELRIDASVSFVRQTVCGQFVGRIVAPRHGWGCVDDGSSARIRWSWSGFRGVSLVDCVVQAGSVSFNVCCICEWRLVSLLFGPFQSQATSPPASCNLFESCSSVMHRASSFASSLVSEKTQRKRKDLFF